jgi:hypothetical protein
MHEYWEHNLQMFMFLMHKISCKKLIPIRSMAKSEAGERTVQCSAVRLFNKDLTMILTRQDPRRSTRRIKWDLDFVT